MTTDIQPDSLARLSAAADLPNGQATKGIRRNRALLFRFELTGREIYDLLALLEDRAVAETSYLRVRQAVYFAERVREQARREGF